MLHSFKSRFAIVAAAGVAAALVSAAPAAAQYYDYRGYGPAPYQDPAYRPRGYGPPPGYYQERRGYGPPRGYGQGGYYVDKETAKRNARALKEAQKDAIKSGRGGYYAPAPQLGAQPRGTPGGAVYGIQPGRTAGQNGVPDDPYRNRN